MEKESVVRLRITREEKVLLHKGRVFRMVLPDVPVRLFFFYLVTSWKKGYYNKDLIGRHIMLKSWSKIQNKVRIEEITP